jgi:nucleoside-diphosphate-sugar epimerase
VEWFTGDILDVVSLQDAMNGVDAVIHTAAIVSFAANKRKEMYQVNVEGTANVVNVALDCGVSRFIHISSVAALGRTAEASTVNEDKEWKESKSNTHYSMSKHEAEMHVWRGFAEGLEGVVLNPSTILGYGDWHQSSAALFRNAWKEFPWYTRGINGFVGVKDVAEIVAQLVYAPLSQQRFIVNSDNWSFRKLLETIAENLDKRKPHREAGPILGGIAWRLEKIKSAFTGSPALLTRETARVAQSKTSFSNAKILRALPGFHFTPLETVIELAANQYGKALESGAITL